MKGRRFGDLPRDYFDTRPAMTDDPSLEGETDEDRATPSHNHILEIDDDGKGVILPKGQCPQCDLHHKFRKQWRET